MKDNHGLLSRRCTFVWKMNTLDSCHRLLPMCIAMLPHSFFSIDGVDSGPAIQRMNIVDEGTSFGSLAGVETIEGPESGHVG